MANLIAQDAARSCRAEPIVISPPAIAFITPRWCASLDTIGAIWKSDMKNISPSNDQHHLSASETSKNETRLPTQNISLVMMTTKPQSTRWQAIGFGIASFALLTLCAMLIAGPSHATAEVPQVSINLDDVESGQLLLRSDNAVSSAILLSTDVKINIAGTISRTVVSQRFINTGETWAEGVYVFPIGETAAVDTLKMRIGDRFIEGTIKEKKAAKIAYEKAKDEGKKASLIEQQKPNLFTNTIANIGPGEIVTVQIEFQTKLSPRNGFWEMRVPLVSAPRYTSQPILQQVKFNASGFAANDLNSSFNEATDIKFTDNIEIVNPVEITIDLKPGFAVGSIESQFHEVDLQEISKDHHKIELTGPVSSDRDFVLKWTSDNKGVETSLFKEQQNGSEHYLLTLTPPFEISNTKTPEREIIFVQDISGSMSGEPLRQSKLGLEMAIQRLTPTDKFNLVFFDDSYFSYAINPVSATSSEKAKAIKLVRNIQTRGGTEMYPAISYALSNFSYATSAMKQLIFLTDGAVSGESSLFSLISNNLGTARLFTIGIGSAPNSYFMSRAAELGRGSHLHIGKTAEISAKMNELFLKIENPAITDLKLTLPKGFDAEYYPNPLPDLYVGDPVSIAIKGKHATGSATLEGKIGNRAWSVKVPLDQAAHHVGIAKVWAREKIANLERARIAQNSNSRSKDNIDGELLQTALSYGLVSRLSSLVALDITPSRPLMSRLTKSKLPLAIPYGWDTEQFEFLRQDILPPMLQKTEAPFAKLYKANLETNSATYALPQTALNWKHGFMFALLALFLGILLLWASRKRSNV